MVRLGYILFVLAGFFFISPSPANAFVLVIDPGHGGKDTGATGKKGKEKNINLAVSMLVGQCIASDHPDVKVIYTRTRDVFIGLNERAEIANKANANLFISIHTNAMSKNSKIKGAEVYTFGVAQNEENLEVAKRENSVILLEDNYEHKYEGFNPNSAESYIIFEFMMNLYAEQSINFASMVQREFINIANRPVRGVKQAGYLVLRKSAMPRILIELDYISNSESENYLLSSLGQKQLALSICKAFDKYKKAFDAKDKGQTNNDFSGKTRRDLKKTVPTQSASSGRIYKIQILASGKKLPVGAPELKKYKTSYFVEGKYYKYTYGESADRKEIERLHKIVSKDFKDAFIIAFENGVKL